MALVDELLAHVDERVAKVMEERDQYFATCTAAQECATRETLRRREVVAALNATLGALRAIMDAELLCDARHLAREALEAAGVKL